MSEWLALAAIVLAALSGVPGLFHPRHTPAAERLFVGLIGIATLCACMSSVAAFMLESRTLHRAWPVPGGHLAIQVDAISAIFVFQIALLALLGAVYGLEYWSQRSHPYEGRKLRAFYGAVTAGMLLLVVAQSAVLFLVGWEIMALSAFLLVTTEDEKPPVREVGYVYLVATRAGTLCLFAMFALLGAASGTLDFAGWPPALASPLGDAIFVLGLAGFGLKAGVMPLHIWLPGAHASAPSHVSALMSGVLIKTGIYGLVRLTALRDAPPLWWGYTLVALGVVSGVLGVSFAIAQHDLKRLLAYHSVENIGIICMGLGVAVLGRSLGRNELVALGIAGALLHVCNHGLFKALLFLSAGSVLHATGTREIDRLGGLLRCMPRTGLAFLVGAVAICGLPPLNGLISELIIYLGLFRASTERAGPALVAALAAPALALIGALALACFVKVFGAAFLGQARTSAAERAHEGGPAMLWPMAILAACCFFIGLAAAPVSRVLDIAVGAWAGPSASVPRLRSIVPLVSISGMSATLLLLLALLALLAAARGLPRSASSPLGTWDCGYATPTARMQYTSSSFARLLVSLLSWALRPQVHEPRIEPPFPTLAASFRSHVPDIVLDRSLLPALSIADRFLARLRPIQRGSVHLYLVYMLAALIVLLLWR
jgi:hydrogenase-4 component B